MAEGWAATTGGAAAASPELDAEVLRAWRECADGWRLYYGPVGAGWTDEEVEAAVLRGAAGRLALLYLPTYSPRGRLLTAAAAQMDRAPAALDG